MYNPFRPCCTHNKEPNWAFYGDLYGDAYAIIGGTEYVRSICELFMSTIRGVPNGPVGLNFAF